MLDQSIIYHMKHRQTLILGIGNTLLTDEGAGIHAMNLFQSCCSDKRNLNFVDGGTLSFTLASWIEDNDHMIVFDAAELHQPAGTIKTYINEDMDYFLGHSKRSAHEVGLLDLMDIARLTGHLPVNRALIAIQPGYMGWGTQPSIHVQHSLICAAEKAMSLVHRWNNDNTDLHENVQIASKTLTPGS